MAKDEAGSMFRVGRLDGPEGVSVQGRRYPKLSTERCGSRSGQIDSQRTNWLSFRGYNSA